MRWTSGRGPGLVWAIVAGAFLTTALATSVERDGRTRIAELFQSETPNQLAAAPAPETVGPSAEIARLRNETRLLALEKKALSMRLALIEDGGATVTGSIGGRSTASPDGAASPIAGGERDAVEVRITDLPADLDLAEAEPLVDPTVLMSEVAGIPARVVQAGSVSGMYSLEIGSATTLEEARSIWAELRETAPEEAEDLVPLVAMDDRSPNRLWVMAGRFGDEAGAADRCEALEELGAPCSVTSREGRHLPLP